LQYFKGYNLSGARGDAQTENLGIVAINPPVALLRRALRKSAAADCFVPRNKLRRASNLTDDAPRVLYIILGGGIASGGVKSISHKLIATYPPLAMTSYILNREVLRDSLGNGELSIEN